jgi:signal transduction histidine kinase
VRSSRGRHLGWRDAEALAESLAEFCSRELPDARVTVLRVDPATGVPEALATASARPTASQEQLLVSEEMAASGRETTGIEHEIASPLAGVLSALQLIRSYADEYQTSLDDPEVGVDDHRAIAADIGAALELAEHAATKAAQFVRSIQAQTRTVALQSELDGEAEVSGGMGRPEPRDHRGGRPPGSAGFGERAPAS